jgi:hypothetical protein
VAGTKHLWQNMELTTIKVVENPITEARTMINPPYAFAMEKKFVAIKNGDWKRLSARQKLNVDYLVVTNHANCRLSDLLWIYSPDSVVLTGNIFSSKKDKWIKENDSLNLKIRDVSTDGALFLVRERDND